MTTQEAIDFITLQLQGVDNNIAEYQKLGEAYRVVLDQLNGVLNTPAADLVEAQTALKAALDDSAAKDAQIAGLVSAADAVQSTPPLSIENPSS